MEMRKFIVEIHPDGHVYAIEYEEPGERLDIRDALRKVDLECCREMVAAWDEHDQYALDVLNRVETLIAQVLDTYWK